MEMKSVKSSNVDRVGYDPVNKVLGVQFKNGGTYHYEDVPSEVHDNLVGAKSIGSVLAKTIIGKFKCVHLEKKE